MNTYKDSKKWGSVYTQGKKVKSLWQGGVKFYDIGDVVIPPDPPPTQTDTFQLRAMARRGTSGWLGPTQGGPPTSYTLYIMYMMAPPEDIYFVFSGSVPDNIMYYPERLKVGIFDNATGTLLCVADTVSLYPPSVPTYANQLFTPSVLATISGIRLASSFSSSVTGWDGFDVDIRCFEERGGSLIFYSSHTMEWLVYVSIA